MKPCKTISHQILSLSAAVLAIAVLSVPQVTAASDDDGYRREHRHDRFEQERDQHKNKHRKRKAPQHSVVLATQDPGDAGLGNGEERMCLDLDMVNLLQSKKDSTATLFLGIDGVRLADTGFWASNDPQCWDATNSVFFPMKDLVAKFLAQGGVIEVCPICWGPRAAEGSVTSLIPGAVFGNSETIPATFLGAEKVISF